MQKQKQPDMNKHTNIQIYKSTNNRYAEGNLAKLQTQLEDVLSACRLLQLQKKGDSGSDLQRSGVTMDITGTTTTGTGTGITTNTNTNTTTTTNKEEERKEREEEESSDNMLDGDGDSDGDSEDSEENSDGDSEENSDSEEEEEGLPPNTRKTIKTHKTHKTRKQAGSESSESVSLDLAHSHIYSTGSYATSITSILPIKTALKDLLVKVRACVIVLSVAERRVA